MTYKSFLKNIRQALDSLAAQVTQEVQAYASSVWELDERIDDAFDEYNVANSDYAPSFRDDLEDLIGRRRARLEDLETILEEAKEALVDAQASVQDLIDRFDTMGDDDACVPRYDDYTIPDM